MSRERTNCNPKVNLIPEGTHMFRVIGEVKKKYGGENKDKEFYIWTLDYGKGTGDQIFMPNMQGDLLRILGATEYEPNHYEWDTTQFDYKTFIATVTHAPDKKDPRKIRSHMGEFKEVTDETIPF